MGTMNGLGHIAIQTKDMGKSVQFYEKIGGKKQQEAEVPGKKLALVELGGVTLELIEPTDSTKVGAGAGDAIPHFAIAVSNMDEVIQTLREQGVDSFMTPEKVVMPGVFGGLQNIFFTGPSGEQIELLEML